MLADGAIEFVPGQREPKYDARIVHFMMKIDLVLNENSSSPLMLFSGTGSVIVVNRGVGDGDANLGGVRSSRCSSLVVLRELFQKQDLCFLILIWCPKL